MDRQLAKAVLRDRIEKGTLTAFDGKSRESVDFVENADGSIGVAKDIITVENTKIVDKSVQKKNLQQEGKSSHDARMQELDRMFSGIENENKDSELEK